MKAQTSNAIAFTDSEDIIRMQRLQSAYTQSFPEGQSNYCAAPNIINNEETTQDYLFFSSRKVLCLPVLLKPEEIQMDYYHYASENFNQSPVRDYSLAVISTGMDYIKKRENDALRRIGGLFPFSKPYDNIQDPRYYVIHIVAKRLKDLCEYKIGKSLASEYHYLGEFISKVLEMASDFFKTSHAGGFHSFLYEAQNKVRLMKKMVLICHEKSSIPLHLTGIVNLLKAYQNELAVLLIYLLSNAPHNETFHSSYLELENDLRVEKTFLSSQTYTAVRLAYLRIRLQFIRTSFSSIKSLEGDFGAQKLKESVHLYNSLLELLFKSYAIVENTELLLQSSNLEGEWETARDEALSFVLDANLTIVLEFLKEVDRAANIIYHNSSCANKKSNCTPGFPKNIQYAHKKLLGMQEIHKNIQKNCCEIRSRVENIKALNPETKETIKDKIILKTNQLIDDLRKRLPRIPLSLIKGVEQLADKKTNNYLFFNTQGFNKAKIITVFNSIEPDFHIRDFFQFLLEEIETELDISVRKFLGNLGLIKNLLIEFACATNEPKGFISKPVYLLIAIEEMINKLKYQYFNFKVYSISHISVNSLFANFYSNQVEKINQLLLNIKNTHPFVLKKISLEIQSEVDRRINVLENQFYLVKLNFPRAMHNGLDQLRICRQKLKSYGENFDLPGGDQLDACQQQSVVSFLKLSIQLKYCQDKESFKKILNKFYQKLKSTHYTLHYGGGEVIRFGEIVRKVPAHIKKMITLYNKNIGASSSLEDYRLVLEKMLAIAYDAVENKSFQVRFFKARDQSTHHIYQSMIEGYGFVSQEADLPARNQLRQL